MKQHRLILSSGILQRKQKNPLKQGHQVELLQSGESYFNAILRAIHAAQKNVHIQVYIFEGDNTGNQVLQALKQAAARGVSVFLVVDAFGSSLKEETIRQIQNLGIYVKQYSPFFTAKGFHVGIRLHHKIVLVDDEVAFIGGINIADKYHGSATEPAWLDFAVQINGPVVATIKKACLDILQMQSALPSIPPKIKPGKRVRILQNNWLKRKIGISHAYRQAIRRADKELILVASYFLPGMRMRRLLKRARKRGVNITILLGSVSDVTSMKRASNYLYAWMFRNGFTIYEWKSSVLHGKIAIADNKWVTVGSYNINYLSDYGSIEMNVEIADKAFAEQTKQVIENLIATGCEEITETKYKKRRTWIVMFMDWVSYQIIRTSFKLMFLLMKREQ